MSLAPVGPLRCRPYDQVVTNRCRISDTYAGCGHAYRLVCVGFENITQLGDRRSMDYQEDEIVGHIIYDALDGARII